MGWLGGNFCLSETVTTQDWMACSNKSIFRFHHQKQHGKMNLKALNVAIERKPGFLCRWKPCETIRNLGISSHMSCSWGAKSQTFPTDSSATASIISGQSMPAVAYPKLLCNWRIFFALETCYQNSSCWELLWETILVVAPHQFPESIILSFSWVKPELSSYVSRSFLWPITHTLSQSEPQFRRFFCFFQVPRFPKWWSRGLVASNLESISWCSQSRSLASKHLAFKWAQHLHPEIWFVQNRMMGVPDRLQSFERFHPPKKSSTCR